MEMNIKGLWKYFTACGKQERGKGIRNNTKFLCLSDSEDGNGNKGGKENVKTDMRIKLWIQF